MALQLTHEFIPGFTADYWRIKRVTLNKTTNGESAPGLYGLSCEIGLYRSKEAAEAGEGALTVRTEATAQPVTVTDISDTNPVRLMYQAIRAGDVEHDPEAPYFWAGAVDA